MRKGRKRGEGDCVVWGFEDGFICEGREKGLVWGFLLMGGWDGRKIDDGNIGFGRG